MKFIPSFSYLMKVVTNYIVYSYPMWRIFLFRKQKDAQTKIKGVKKDFCKSFHEVKKYFDVEK